MIRIASNMHISNVWLLDTGRERILIDTGYTLERPLLQKTLWRWGIRAKGDLAAVILTHRHSDHAANAAWLRATFDAPIVCHEDDARVLMGAAPAPKLCGVAHQHLHERLLSMIEDRLPARCQVDEALQEGRWRKNFKVFHVAGHTEGSILILHEPSATLFSGDAILAGLAPFRFIEKIALAVPGFSLDVEAVRQRTRAALAEVGEVHALCAGHGPLVDQQAAAKIMKLRGYP